MALSVAPGVGVGVALPPPVQQLIMLAGHRREAAILAPRPDSMRVSH